MIKFKGRIVFIGCGSVAQCALALLFDVIEIDRKNITIIDGVDNRHRLSYPFHYVVQKITKENYAATFSKYLRSGDFLVDLSVGIQTEDLLSWCSKNGVLFLNTSIEEWDPFELARQQKLSDQTLYMRRMRMKESTDKLPKDGPTAIIEHGANPGLVSHFAKQGLLDIAKLKSHPNYAKLARDLGVKAIHVSEKDTQETSVKRGKGEFVNTWSCDGFIEEAIAPAELGFGTHEKQIPFSGFEHTVGPKHQIFLRSKGCQSYVRSWVPSGEIKGMLIRHGEAYTLCEALSLKDYRPTVHYAYNCCEQAMASLKELEEQNWEMPQKKRILYDEIEAGKDELGCLLLGHADTPWWIGSILDIHEARKLAPHQNATTVQVAIGVIVAMAYAMENPRLGFHVPDDLDHEFIIKVARPFLGQFISQPLSCVKLKEKDFQLENLLIQESWK